jgi:hypothetical protein
MDEQRAPGTFAIDVQRVPKKRIPKQGIRRRAYQKSVFALTREEKRQATAAQALAVEVLTNFASLEAQAQAQAPVPEPERASTPVDFEISAMVIQYALVQGLGSSLA